MIKRIAIAATLSVAFFALGVASRADAAVPTAVVRFEASTDFEKSLENYLLQLFTTLQRRQEDFTKTFELGKIEAAREDVNKLVFDTLRELKEGSLGGAVLNPGETQTVLKGLGLKITGAAESFKCASGAYVGGACVVVKREGRIITNTDQYLYEEPLQKARDYVSCYYNFLQRQQARGGYATYSLLPNPDPDSPTTEYIRDSIFQLELQKIDFLGSLQRTERGSLIAPPPTWYRSGNVATINWDNITQLGQFDKLVDLNKCEVILRNTVCHEDLGCYNKSLVSDFFTPSESDPERAADLLTDSYRRAGFRADPLTETAELKSPDVPDAKTNVAASPIWDWDLVEKARNPVNTLSGLEQKVGATIRRIITEAHENRKAQLVAGQGLRPQTYLIGWPDTVATAENLRGTYYFFDTENIISPAFVLLAKVQSAIQAQFDLAQKAYKYPPDKDVNVEQAKYEFSHQTSGTPIALPLDASQATTTPKISKLPAPFEDFSSYLALPAELYERPSTYAQGGPPNTQTKTPDTNYLNKFFKEVLQLHERSFSDVLARWFTDEATFFRR